MRSKAEVLSDLRGMLRDVFAAKAAGQAYARVARAHGYVDGYMRALLETGLCTRAELLEVVAAEREQVSGPAMREVVILDEPILGAGERAGERAGVVAA
jgi:hypothetical protein